MRVAAFKARLAAIEWHGNLWRLWGAPIERCTEMIRHCAECLDADDYGVPRAAHDDPEIVRMERYLDRLFSFPCVEHDGWGNVTCFH